MVRLVLYCEGSRESGRKARLPRTPGDRFDEHDLGPAHVLTRRLLGERAGLAREAVVFEAPLRSRRGVELRGSDLLVPARLRAALTWPMTGSFPDVAVVIVDRDGDERRRSLLYQHVHDLVLPRRAIAVAVEEFEAWLLADTAALAASCERTAQDSPTPESLPCGEAKARLREWTGRQDPAAAHLAIARTCDVELVARKCESFADFARDLVAALPR